MAEAALSGQADAASGNTGSGSGAGAAASGDGTGAGSGQAAASGSSAGWREQLPEDIRNHAAITGFQDISAMTKSFIHAQSMIGKKGVIVPGEKATEEEWSAFYKSIGVPTEEDKYGVEIPKDSQMSKETMSKFKGAALKMGILPKQAQGLLNWYLGFEKEQQTAFTGQIQSKSKEALDGLKKEWGDGYDKNLALAKLGITEVGGEELQKHILSLGLGDDVQVIRAFNKVGAMLGEDKLRGAGGGGFSGQTPAEIQGEIAEIMSNPKHPYFDSTHQGHKLAVEKVAALYKKLPKSA